MAIDTKKKLEEDVTKNPQATTAADVNNQDARTRLWQSLNTTYGQQMEESDKAYDKAISQQDNAMMARGMGRSSYAGQIRANMYNDKATARNQLGEKLIADYQNRIGEIEAQEKEDDRWERQFAENQRQYNENLAFQQQQFGYQKQHDTVADQQWNKQFGENQRQFNATQELTKSENALNRAFTTQERIASENFQTNMTKLQQAFQASESSKAQQAQKDLQLLQQAWQSGENKLNREQQAALQRLEQEFQSGENAKNRDFQQTMQELQQAFTAKENAANRALTQQQIDEQHLQNTIQNQQWQQSFNAQQAQNAIQNQQWEQSFNAQQAQNTIQNQQWEQSFNAQQQQNTIQNQQWEQQFNAQQAQWREQFDYNSKSNLQKISMEKVMAIIQNGNDPDDTLLGQAGMTRAEANGMKKQVQSGGSTFNPGKSDWQSSDFPDEATYNAAKAAGISSYREYVDATNKLKGAVTLFDAIGHAGGTMEGLLKNWF